MNKINDYHIISFGDECTIAKNLNLLGIRNSSMPFDWIQMYDFQEILNLLYLKKSFSLKDITKKPKNAFYNNTHKLVHFHDNINMIEQEELKFKRRFDKIFDLFDTNNNIVFLKYYRPDIKEDFSYFFPNTIINKIKLLNDRIINDCISFTNFMNNINEKYNKNMNIKFIQICPIKQFNYNETLIDNINNKLEFKNCSQIIINEPVEDGDFKRHKNNFHNKHVINCLKIIKNKSYNDINDITFI
jgi:hypothetical protein